MPQVIEVIDTRLATSGMLTSRSFAIDSRNGARVVPLEVAAKEPRQAAPIRAQGRAREALVDIKGRRPYRPRRWGAMTAPYIWYDAAMIGSVLAAKKN